MRFLLAVLLWVLVEPSYAEPVRWRTPDGREGFSDRSAVPRGAAILGGRRSIVNRADAVEQLEPASAAGPAAQHQGDAAPQQTEAVEHAKWVAKREEAERELRDAERDVRIYAECKVHEDHDFGYNQFMARGCDEYGRGALKAAKARRRAAREYLENGLYEECRKAPDCQPGYLR